MKTKNIELKDQITVDEYKAWLTGLLRGKGSELPNLEDWKAIKKMTDKIVPDVVEIPPPTYPQPYYPQPSYPDPYQPSPWWITQPSTCNPINLETTGTGRITGDNITIGSLADCVSGDSYAGCGPYGYPVGAETNNVNNLNDAEDILANIKFRKE